MRYRVLGIDPGLSQTGWGMIDSDGIRHTHIDHGTIITEKVQHPEQRLLVLHKALTHLIQSFSPVAMGIETLFFNKNISSALPVAQARGIALLAAAQNHMQVMEFAPVTIKQSVAGSGAAGKEQIQKMIQLLLGLAAHPKSNHAADALAAAITLIHHRSIWSTVLMES